MCGIFGVFNKKDSYLDTIKSLKIMENRGRDGCGIASKVSVQYAKNTSKLKYINSDNFLGHLLHSVVGSINQPIIKKGTLVANSEIYNWKELKNKYHLKSKNDSELIIDLIEKKGVKSIKGILNEFDGVYAFAYWYQNKIYLARDKLGVKPIWYQNSDYFSFASEKKGINGKIIEVNPRTILIYDINSKKITKIKREFFKLKTNKDLYPKIKQKTKQLLFNAIKKRIPDGKFGILFSGGVDSTFITQVCKEFKQDFVCYTSALSEPTFEEARDLKYAKKAAIKLGLKLKIKTINLSEVKKELEIIPNLIEDNNVVKVGVALTFNIACKEAKKDGVKVIFSGLGSEEIFAGYNRHKNSQNVNKECLSGLLKIYERDLYRDDVITMNNNLELRLPFLDKFLVEYALSIPEKYKIENNISKYILRDIAYDIEIPKEFAFRKKQAAQYGSKFDRALQKLAKSEGKSKSEYLKRHFYPSNLNLGVLWSGGKDSAYAAYLMKNQNYNLSCLISVKSKNQESFMFHTPNIDLVSLQARAADLPLIIQKTDGKKESELMDLKLAIIKAKEKFGIEGIVTGAIFSNYQRDRIEKICDELHLKIFAPLWHKDQNDILRELITNNFKVIFSSIAADGLNKDWLGKYLSQIKIKELAKINKKIGLNMAGEGGEFESFVLECPLFRKKIVIEKSKIIMEKDYIGRYQIIGAKLM